MCQSVPAEHATAAIPAAGEAALGQVTTNSKGVQLAVGSRVKVYGPSQQLAAEAIAKVVGMGSLLMERKPYKVLLTCRLQIQSVVVECF
jgi:hypothetical protein